MGTSFLFEFNWSGDGTTWVDESANVFATQLKIGAYAQSRSPTGDPVPQVGMCTLTLDNATQRYSPDYSGGALYGNLVPRRQIRVRATDGVTTWTLFRGFVDSITPQAGSQSRREVLIACVDAIALLRYRRVSMALQLAQRADQLISALVTATYAPPATNYRTGISTLDVAADHWTADRTAALDAISESAASEFGRFFIQRDGTPTFYDRNWFFQPISAALTLNAHPFTLTARRDADQIFNVLSVKVYPRATAGTVGVLAQSATVLRIPPTTPTGPSERKVVMHFRDSAGNIIGGTGLVTPLTPTTDYVVNERPDGSGVDYTNDPAFSFGTLDIRGAEIIIPLQNAAIGALYVTKLQVRGKPITTYDPLVQSQEDAASQSAYQKRSLAIDLPLSADANFAEALAYYLLDRFKAPFTAIEQITLHNTPLIDSTNVFSINLFDALLVTDAQTGLSSVTCRVVGIALDITAQDFTLTYFAERADDRVYWNLGVTGYGELGTNTRLAP